MKGWAALLSVTIAAAVPACGMFMDLNTAQCVHARDCNRFGEGYDCADNGCVPHDAGVHVDSDVHLADIDATAPIVDASVPRDADAGDVGDAGDASTSTSSLVPNGGFELGTECDGWLPSSGAAASRDPLARSGLASCRVCAVSTSGLTFVTPPLDIEPQRGERYRLRAYVHSAPDAGSALLGMGVVLQTNGGERASNQYGDVATPGEIWTRAEITYTVSVDAMDGGPGLSLVAYFNTNWTGSPGRCLLVDDVTIERLP